MLGEYNAKVEGLEGEDTECAPKIYLCKRSFEPEIWDRHEPYHICASLTPVFRRLSTTSLIDIVMEQLSRQFEAGRMARVAMLTNQC